MALYGIDFLKALSKGLKEVEVEFTDDVTIFMPEHDREFCLESWDCGTSACAMGIAPQLLGDDCPYYVKVGDGYSQHFGRLMDKRHNTIVYGPSITRMSDRAFDYIFMDSSYEFIPTPTDVAERIDNYLEIVGE